MPVDHRERAFEAAIEHHLLTSAGYAKGDPTAFDREQAIFPTEFITFVKATQPEVWQALEKLHGTETEAVILDDLTKALDGQAGALAVIRHGFKCFGKLIRVAYFAPAHGMNPESRRLYEANRLSITRQVHYSTKHENSIDVVLALNGIPVATAELKNPLTGQNAEHAKHQYKTDRDPRERIFEFKRRTLVHFAVDPDVVWMTTKLEGSKTVFLPFNKGNGSGAGNPDNPAGYKTAYLWEEVWQRDSWLDILGRFVHLQVEERTIDGKKIRKETMIFPRYHQLVAVRALEADAKAKGVGQNYLIQHSAGSGKSNSIAWLAHRLASLHNAQDEKVFDVALKFYRLQKISEGSIRLDQGENVPVEGPTAVGTRKARDDEVELSRLIDLINERFGTDFTQADELFFHQLREEAIADENLRQAATANTLDNFRYVFVKALEGLFIDRMEQNEEIFAKYMNDADFRKVVSEHLLKQVYEQIREEGGAA
jgi:hypothetical protein